MGVGSQGGAWVSVHWLAFSLDVLSSFMSRNDSFLASATVGASATNHLCVGGRDESGLEKNPLWFSRDWSRDEQRGGCWHRGPVSQTGPSLLMDALVSQWRP